MVVLCRSGLLPFDATIMQAAKFFYDKFVSYFRHFGSGHNKEVVAQRCSVKWETPVPESLFYYICRP